MFFHLKEGQDWKCNCSLWAVEELLLDSILLLLNWKLSNIKLEELKVDVIQNWKPFYTEPPNIFLWLLNIYIDKKWFNYIFFRAWQYCTLTILKRDFTKLPWKVLFVRLEGNKVSRHSRQSFKNWRQQITPMWFQKILRIFSGPEYDRFFNDDCLEWIDRAFTFLSHLLLLVPLPHFHNKNKHAYFYFICEVLSFLGFRGILSSAFDIFDY